MQEFARVRAPRLQVDNMSSCVASELPPDTFDFTCPVFFLSKKVVRSACYHLHSGSLVGGSVDRDILEAKLYKTSAYTTGFLLLNLVGRRLNQIDMLGTVVVGVVPIRFEGEGLGAIREIACLVEYSKARKKRQEKTLSLTLYGISSSQT